MTRRIKFDPYKYGFRDEDQTIIDSGLGISDEIVRKISAFKNEPQWVLDFRLKAFKKFKEMPLPSFGPKLDDLNFDSYTYLLVSLKVKKEIGMMFLLLLRKLLIVLES